MVQELNSTSDNCRNYSEGSTGSVSEARLEHDKLINKLTPSIAIGC